LVEEGKRKKMGQVSRDGVAGGERNRWKTPPGTVAGEREVGFEKREEISENGKSQNGNFHL
jgi:hypothetical protein